MNLYHPKAYIVILNWNRWADTLECLESVFCNIYENYEVIVCDNNSADGSIEKILAWADGKLCPYGQRADIPLQAATKPIPYLLLDKVTAERGGSEYCAEKRSLIVIKTGGNLGFAGGNNVGLRYALARGDFKYVWLLNNDTIIDPDALRHLVNKMRENPSAGICGSTLICYDHTNVVQVQGGSSYNKWLGIAKPIGANKPKENLLSMDEVERQIDYVAGASMLVSREFLLDIGIMSEDYFLYNEEIDWAVRGNKTYRLGYAEKSVVYHKEGASIGTSTVSKNRSVMSEYFIIRNRFLFTYKYFPYALPIVFAGFVVTVINRIRRREWEKILPVLTAALFFRKRCGRYSPLP